MSVRQGNNVLAGRANTSIPRYDALPVATATFLGVIAQYTGITNATYTNGFLYKCVSDGQTPATYSWEQWDTQPKAETSTLRVFATQKTRKGWLYCDGSAISRTDYADLAADFEDPNNPGHYIYGDGDGSTTFNLPDFTGAKILNAGLPIYFSDRNTEVSLGYGRANQTFDLFLGIGDSQSNNNIYYRSGQHDPTQGYYSNAPTPAWHTMKTNAASLPTVYVYIKY